LWINVIDAVAVSVTKPFVSAEISVWTVFYKPMLRGVKNWSVVVKFQWGVCTSEMWPRSFYLVFVCECWVGLA